MRFFLLLLVSGWLWGIVSSAYGIPWGVSAAVAAICMYVIASRYKISVQLIIAISCLWFLGTVYGTSVPLTKTAAHEKAAQSPVYIVVNSHIRETFAEPEASFVSAMLLAEQGTVDYALKNQFKKTGTTHILAISGLNISLLTGMLLAVLMPLLLSPLKRSLITISVVWGYMLFIGWPISAVRAALFWTLTLLALHTQRLISLFTVLLLTMLLLISYSPALLQDISFQLSITAVAGIGLTLFLLRGLPQRIPRFIRIIINLTSASIGATLFTWPVIMYHFGTISIISIPANLLLEPIFPLMLVLGIITVLLSFILPPLSLLGAFLFHGLYIYMDYITATFSSIPGVYYEDLSIPWQGIICYYFLITASFVAILRLQRRSWKEVWM